MAGSNGIAWQLYGQWRQSMRENHGSENIMAKWRQRYQRRQHAGASANWRWRRRIWQTRVARGAKAGGSGRQYQRNQQ